MGAVVVDVHHVTSGAAFVVAASTLVVAALVLVCVCVYSVHVQLNERRPARLD